MPTLTFLIALFFASFAPATTHAPEKSEHKSKTTITKKNNCDYLIGDDIHP